MERPDLACSSFYCCALGMASSVHCSYMLLHLFLLSIEFLLPPISCFPYGEKYPNVWSLGMFFTNVKNTGWREKIVIPTSTDRL